MKNLKMKPLCFAVSVLTTVASMPTLAEIKEITLLHTNDIESVYEPIDAFYNTMWKGNRKGLTVKDPTEIAQKWADKIRDDVDMILVLTHQNKMALMQTAKEADPEVQRGFDEDYEMAGKLLGMDVIFGAHSDNGLIEPVVHPKTGTVIGLIFGQGIHLGYTRFTIDTEKHDVKFLGGKSQPNLNAVQNTDHVVICQIDLGFQGRTVRVSDLRE